MTSQDQDQDQNKDKNKNDNHQSEQDAHAQGDAAEKTATYDPEKNKSSSIGAKFFRLRDYTPVPLIILLILFENVSVKSAVLGLCLALFGEAIRVYSVAYIGSISRTRKNRTGGRLIQEGPFAYVRNPLYVGNFFITFGIAVFGGNLFIIGLAVVLFAVQYHYIVCYEEELLRTTFGEEYQKFCKDVPAWFPRKKIVLDQLDWPDNFSPALKSEGKTLLSITALVAILTFLA